MKKLLIVLAIVLVLVLSGCGETHYEIESDCNSIGLFYDDEGACIEATFYTQEEVDLMLEGYIETVFLDSIDDMCQLITSNGFRDADDCRDVLSWLIDNWEEIEDWNFDFDEDYALLTENEYQDLLQRTNEQDELLIMMYKFSLNLQEDIFELEQRIEELENE